MSNSVCFSGYRPAKYDYTHEIKKIICQKLAAEISICVKYGCDIFYFGGAPGLDLLAAHVVVYLKRIFEIRLICALPYENFYTSYEFDESWRKDYLVILPKCDEVINVSGNKEKECNVYMNRNKFMVDNSDILICLYDGKKGGTQNTIFYAQQKGIRIINILPL